MKILVFFLVIAIVTAAKVHKRKHHKKHVLKEFVSNKDLANLLAEDEREVEEEEKRHITENDLLGGDEFNNNEGGYAEELDPCRDHKCGPGKECEITDEGKANCACVKHCPEEVDSRRKVCSNHNETWDNDCALYQMRCYCTEEMEECKDLKYEHVHVDYYGPCKDIGECTKEELEDFPRRMRDWLFNVMQELARREELRGVALRLEKEAEGSRDRKWVNAVIWKFCDLDVHPKDRHVSRHELFPIRAPLMAVEHCIAPFLDSCDADNDHKITLYEWGHCLGLKEDEIEDKCNIYHKG